MLVLAPNRPPVAVVAPVTLDAHLSYGQSWRSNDFVSFDAFDLNENGPVPFLVASLGAFLGPGPMPNSAGISLSGLPIGTTHYRGGDTFTVGRSAVLAHQLLRIRDGASVPPTLEVCAAFPGSTWTTGLGGGLAPGSVFTGSISGTTLTVESMTSGYVSGGQLLTAAGVNANTRVYANLTLAARTMEDVAHLRDDNPEDLDIQQLVAGGVGTYELNLMFTTLDAQFTGTSPAAVFRATASYGTMTVNQIISGSLAAGQGVSGGVLPAGTIFTRQLSGTTGGVGTYLLGLPQTVTSRMMNGKGTSWTNMLAIIAATPPGSGCFPTREYTRWLPSSVGYTQGGATDNTRASKEADLTEMLVQFDALNLNPTPMKLYLSLPSVTSNTVTFSDSVDGAQSFARKNAPGAGGPYSGRVYASGPSYGFQFNGADNIHTGDYGSSRWGEIEGYARWLVQDKGVQWTPLWRPLTGGAIVRAGQVVTVPFARPAGPDFASAPMVWQNDPVDGIKDWPQKGFHVRRGGVELTVAPTISGMTVQLAVTETINAGDSLELSYAWYGPGGPNPGLNSGVGGNLVMNGPNSVLYPNGWNGAAKTIDAWAWPFVETVTV